MQTAAQARALAAACGGQFFTAYEMEATMAKARAMEAENAALKAEVASLTGDLETMASLQGIYEPRTMPSPPLVAPPAPPPAPPPAISTRSSASDVEVTTDSGGGGGSSFGRALRSGLKSLSAASLSPLYSRRDLTPDAEKLSSRLPPPAWLGSSGGRLGGELLSGGESPRPLPPPAVSTAGGFSLTTESAGWACSSPSSASPTLQEGDALPVRRSPIGSILGRSPGAPGRRSAGRAWLG